MKLRPFELGLVITFSFLFLMAMFLLKTYEPATCEEEGTCANIGGTVTIWGTLPDQTFTSLFKDLSEDDESFSNVSYRYVSEEDFDEAFLNALADQSSPDLLFMSHEKLVEHRNRLQSISYENYPIRDFRSRYIDGASIFALNDGIYAFPIMVDPLMQYWNRDTFSNKGFLAAPKNWEELVNIYIPALTVRDFNRNIQSSAVAMGEYKNIKNALPFISALLLQSDSSFIQEDKNQYRVLIDQSIDGKNEVFAKSLDFYTSISNVNDPLYSWNRTLNLDRDRFLSEDLAIYFGLGSEGKDIELKNPNLSFDIAEIPQSLEGDKRTYGNFYGFFIPKVAKNKSGASIVMQVLSSDANAKIIADGYNMAPVSRNLLMAGSNDVYGRLIYQSAPNARGWLNPDLDRLGTIIDEELTNISSNRQTVHDVTGDITSRLGQIY